jgi:hypothetical protein
MVAGLAPPSPQSPRHELAGPTLTRQFERGSTLLPSPSIPRPIFPALSTPIPWPKGDATVGGTNASDARLSECVLLKGILTPLAQQDAGGPGDDTPRGLSLWGYCARWRPCTSQNSPLAGTRQVAFLGEIEPRAARPGEHVRRTRAVGWARPSAVKIGGAGGEARGGRGLGSIRWQAYDLASVTT